MTNFDRAFGQVIGFEGGYSNHVSDRGGETKYGISKAAYPGLDIKNLTLEQAKTIYYNDYWRKLNCHLMTDLATAKEVFEQAVNFGLTQAGKHLQQGLNYLGASLDVDGVIGSLTLDAANSLKTSDCLVLVKVLNGLQFKKYLEIVEKDASQKVFARGWLSRVQI
jgi:lysozyme family protein